MSEEEKDIIKDFLGLREIHSNNSNSVSYLSIYQNAVKKMLNLINKQQKEIENLANGIKILGTNPSITTEEIIEEFRKNPISKEYLKKFRKEYISKDKIRERIEEARKIRWHTPKLVIEYFEELLEEK